MIDGINYLANIRSGEIGLVNVPRKFKTYTICFAAVSMNGMDLYHVPGWRYQLRGGLREFCRAAVIFVMAADQLVCSAFRGRDFVRRAKCRNV